MDGWIEFWKWAYLIGLTGFFALSVVLIPLGIRDLFALFKHLSGSETDNQHR